MVCLSALLATACGGGRDGGGTGAGGPLASGDAATTTITSTACPTGNCDVDGGVVSGASTTTGPSGSTSKPAARRPASASTTTAPPTSGPTVDEPPQPEPGSGDVTPTATDDGSQGPPGAFARTLLRPRPATQLVLERSAQPGAAVADAAVNRSAGEVAEAADKPVDVRATTTLASTDTDWTAEEIRSTADAAAKVAQGNGRAVLRLLVLKGTFEGSEDVLGVAVRGDVLALFPDNIARAATPLVSRSAIEDAVLLHELGHVLGLVDLARNTGRADKEHPGHSANSASVMYWAIESSLVGQVLNGPPPKDFDAADRADLRALRDGA